MDEVKVSLQIEDCPVLCGRRIVEKRPADYGERRRLHCPYCGNFEITRRAEALIRGGVQPQSEKSRLLSHMIRRAQESQERPLFDVERIKNILKAGSLPTVQEQADRLLLRVGQEMIEEPGGTYSFEFGEIGAIVGARTDGGLGMIFEGLHKEGWLLGSPRTCRMTFRGWQRYEELLRGKAAGNKAFIAMQFNDSELDAVLENCLRPAVMEVGFRLERLDDHPKAGLIDDRMRVEIRGARFLIADMTHHNRGAYWEAGYAEGLRKPVIYTCKKSVFESVDKPHFDTNHHLMVLWDTSDLTLARQQLKATIRATIPEAKQADPEE